MKKKILCLLLVALLLSGCAAPVTPTGTTGSQVPATGYTAGNLDKVKLTVMGDSNPMPGFDAQNKYAVYIPPCSFQEADSVFFGNTMFSTFLYYYDKPTGISSVLCADPACTHDSKNCGAYVSYGAAAFYYDNQRWWIGSDEGQKALLRSDMSGLNQVTVKNISMNEIIMPYQPQQYAIHRGNLFALGRANIVNGASVQTRYSLLASPLDGTEEFVAIFDETIDVGTYNSVRFVGNSVYYTLISRDEDFHFNMKITRYDIVTGTYEIVYEVSDTPDHLNEPWVTDQGEIYIPGTSGDTACVWKLENGQRVLVTSWPDASASSPFVADGIIARITQDDGVKNVEIRDFSGATLYQGLLFPEEIPGFSGDPNHSFYAFIGGDTEKMILSLTVLGDNGSQDNMVLLDIQNGMKATLLWSSEH